jgi:hypothetical protein
MGLLSSIGNIAKKATQTFETIVQAPIQSIKTIGNGAAFNALSQKVNAAPLTTQIGKIILNTGTVAAAVIGGGAALGSTTAKSIVASVAPVVSKLVPTSTKGKIAAAVVAPIVAGAVINQPAKTISAVASLPGALTNFGGNAANLVADPSLSNAKTLVKENPVVSTLLGVGAVAAVGGGLGLAANTVATFTNSQATKANTAASAELPTDNLIKVTDRSGEVPPITSTNNNAPTPQMPQTQKISSGSTTKKRKKAKAKPTNMIQNVRVNVVNQSKSIGQQLNKRYLNRQVLLN